MPAYFFVVPDRTPGVVKSSPPFANLEDALRGARFMLGNGAPSAWIADGDGNLVLPADQVRVRLDLPTLPPSKEAGLEPHAAPALSVLNTNASEDA
jgi:hypothetical protein